MSDSATPAVPEEPLPRADVAYLFLISKNGPFVVLRVPAESKGREGRYLVKWAALVEGAKSILAESGLPPEDFLMLDRIIAPWDWTTQWVSKGLMDGWRARARQADAAFDGDPQWYRKHYLYDWINKAFTRVRAPLETAPPDVEPKGTP